MNKLLILLMTLCASASADENLLKACPNKPNCVSSNAIGSQHTPAFRLKPEIETTAKQLATVLQQLEPRISLNIDKLHLHADIRSRVFEFVDELDLIIDPTQGLIHVRSAARTGYYDFGVNRRRIEKLRSSLQQAGLIL